MLSTLRIVPKVLCIGLQKLFNESLWLNDGTVYKKVDGKVPTERFGQTGYVASPGTCTGDSGGPAFVRDGGHFVVTGTESTYCHHI